MADFIKKYIALCLLLFTFCMMIMPHSGHGGDLWCWTKWAEYMFQNGLGQIYNSNSDYLPLYHYILYLYSLSQVSIEEIGRNIYYLKFVTLLFHFVTGFFLALMIKKDQDSWDKVLTNVMYYLLNIAILYNTVIWGQVDAILTCFVFGSIYFAYKKRILLSLIFMVLAINFKLQAIIFLPIVGLMLLPLMISCFSIKKLVKWILVLLILQLLIISPFIVEGTVGSLWAVVTGSVGKYPVVSMNAYNIWDFMLSGNLMQILDSHTFLGISYKSWGLFMFFTTSGIALLPLAKLGYLSIVNRTELNVPLDKILIVCTIIPLLFFYFNTQMHERYTHPAFIFLIAYSLRKKKPLIAIVGCLAYFLNLEDVLRFMKLDNYGTLIFNRDFISSLYLITIIWLFSDLFNFKLNKGNKS